MIDLDTLRVRLPDESTGDHCVRIVRAFAGVSLTKHRDDLVALFTALEDPVRAALVATWETNCASSADAMLCLAGVAPGSRLLDPLRVSVAMTQLREGCKAGRLPGTMWRSIRPGWLMVYWSGVGNDAHVEWCLSTPDAMGVAEHGGGGRPGNAITVETGSILSSWYRPLQEIYDIEKIVVNEATGDNPY